MSEETNDTPNATAAIQRRFRRSVNLERDFYREDGLDGYVVTAKARELVGRLTGAFEASEGQRAWSVMGPYGSGKSACALFAAHLARGSKDAFQLLGGADEDLAERAQAVFKDRFCPVLIVGSRRSLAEALLGGLAQSLDAFTASHEASADELSRLAKQAKEKAAGASDDEAAWLYREAASAVHEATGGGLFVVIDEMGKLLEYAALHPERSDLFVLQRLSEHAARAAEDDAAPAPMALLTILHQAFERYAGRLPTAQREEWQKVQGRFEDFAFVEPADETLRLLARAVKQDPASEAEGQEAVQRLMDAVRLPVHFDGEQVATCLAEALPLHPAVSLAVGPLFRRLAQNERSLFAFLSAGEPHGFSDVMGRDDAPALYRLDHLYDYLVGALGATLFDERMNRLWAETDAALARLEAPTALEERLLKQMAILSFAGDLAGLRPTAELLRVTASAPDADVDAALAALKEARVVTYRPFHEEYHVWQGSDFDLEGHLEDARRQIPARTPLSAMLQKAIPPLPLVARRHSYRTGATRVFEVAYASDETWRTHLKKPHARADGRILYVLPEHDGDPAALKQHLREASAEADDPLTLLAVPKGTEALREAVRDLACFDRVLKADALKGDAAARKEVNAQRAELAGYVHDQLVRLIASDEGGENPCDWIHCGEPQRIKDERALQGALSRICDEVFSKSPEVWNELINRKEPSPSAVYGLKQLLEAMMKSGDKPRLGIEGYPAEYGLYASVLEGTGIHREEEGAWTFGAPQEAGCQAVWKAIADLFEEAEGQRVPVGRFYDQLTAAPYGVREGLLPVFLFAFHLHAGEEIALYEEDAFAPDPSRAEIERFLNNPGKFSFQRVSVSGTRGEVLKRLAPLVGLPEASEEPLPFVIQLLKSIRDLPPYVRKTSRLSDEALAVRETLQRATEPATLLFEGLPKACGVPSFLGSTEPDAEHAEAFVTKLRQALRELGRAYDDLIADIEQQIARAFRLQANDAEECRSELAERAQALLPHVTATSLKSFCGRATDEMLDTQGWYESLAALLAKRSPAQWVDGDRETFKSALTEVAQRFRQREPLYFDTPNESTSSDGASAVAPANGSAPPAVKIRRVRLSITAQDEQEREAVITVRVENETRINDIAQRVGTTLEEGDADVDVQLAALSEVVQSLLEKREDAFKTESA